MSTDIRAPETKTVFVGENALTYCADFSASPAVSAGAALSSPVVAVDVAKVSVGANPAVNTTNFVEYDAAGLAADVVLAGKGVVFSVTPLAKGQCTVTVLATASDGSKPGKQIVFQVK